MSGQQETGMGPALDLEELFLSRDFGRRPARVSSTRPAAVASRPAQLEQVFLSDVFGHPALVAGATGHLEESAPAAVGRPVLVLLDGGPAESSGARRSPHHRTIAAVSGVAAAALAVAGLSAGTARGPDHPLVTQQALGGPAGQGSRGEHGAAQPGPASGQSTPSGAAAHLAASSTGAPGTFLSGGIGTGPRPPEPPNGFRPGSPPGGGVGGAGGGGGGSMLAPVLGAVGGQVSAVSSSVSAMSGGLGPSSPMPPVVQAAGTVSSALNALAAGSPPGVSAASS